MPLIDNRPGSGSGGGGGGVSAPTVAQVKTDYRVEYRSVTGLDLANGFVPTLTIPNDVKVQVNVQEGPGLDLFTDYTVDTGLGRIVFTPATLAILTNVFNITGQLTLRLVYFSA